jgi:hypothetical protein
MASKQFQNILHHVTNLNYNIAIQDSAQLKKIINSISENT